jgi:hypothetical protein
VAAGFLEHLFDVVALKDNVPAIEAIGASVDEYVSRFEFFFRGHRSDQVSTTAAIDANDLCGELHTFTLPPCDKPG